MKRQSRQLTMILILIAVLMGMMFYLSVHKTIPVRDWQQIREDGVLHIVSEYNSVGFYVSGDTLAGWQYDFCKYIEQRSQLKVEIALENNLETDVRKLQHNEYDIIAINIPITTAGRANMAFTNPITRNKQVLVQRKSDAVPLIRNQLDLAGKTVYVPQSSPGIVRLRNLSEEIAMPIYICEVEDYTQEQLIYLVAYQDIDYALVDKAIADNNRALFPNIDVQTDVSFMQLQSWATRRNSPELLDSLNRWLKEFQEK
ncbi:MAG: transporter substrate-binding domain-containing protein [Candidatus Symbiothrix sp.]|jgi:membrane-bound lytic murein transglycosylase MltF|nr:transporter substrate-binding domain-containing protein [Candidatus Symbiothrix sp.]